ncbi:DEAD/DEAH box helicase family protein [Virgibacillus siamensis]|uniref:DEAD/DEAH box helicase family protein n=1 Tax=Virgibacillus siamensis TaxID=480071 RepID=A0ABN1GB32_9BACI
MAIDYTEEGLEANIERSLLESGYRQRRLEGEALKAFQEHAIDVEMLFEFLQKTQSKKMERLKTIYGAKFEKRFLHRLEQELNRRGVIDCIRHGIKDRGVSLRLVYNKPPSKLNKMLIENYESNIFTVSRQVYYSSTHNNSLDTVLFINGLPVVIMELKNQFTGQTVEHAKLQFQKDRDPKELLFQPKKRVAVYFAVDTDEVWMTTMLNKEQTFFLPFNRGNQGGKGNPVIYNNYRTSYLWNSVLQRDSLLDILFRFVYIEKKDVKDATGKVIDEKKIVIFPRYHQLDVVRKVEQDVQENYVGNNYLVQHSAGSGKTNSISWLSHRLAKVHDENNEAIFDSIIVITDRRVLDKQLQDAIYQLEHEAGVVQKIDEDSNQLAEAIQNKTRIIITTLQKFPFIIEKVGEFARGKYGIIIDEAHSSQGGKASTAMTSILSDKSLEDAYEADKVMEEELNDTEEKIVETIEKSGKQNNISFFAFTATPKPKTIEKFGTPNADGIPEPFHVYSMRQAIEEGFILDVLQNYVTYETFYKVEKSIHEDPEVAKRKAAKEIARFVSLHPHSIAQKTAIIVEHYRQVTQHKIDGKAKAMLVTRSRLHAVRYKRAFDDYIKKQNYDDLKTLVAFSGTVDDDGVPYTEAEMNVINEAELPDKFSTDEYQVLIVAEKYQTGFDEPLLHTMYVDKPLSGIKAVQTLSRLNRTCRGKGDTFVLDFVNEPETIQNAFQDYYEVTGLNDVTDPNILYDLEYELGTMQVYTESEINAVSNLEFNGKLKNKQAQARLNPIIDQAVDRFKNELEEEEQDQFKSLATKFIRTYAFVLQIGPFTDVVLHKLYVYLNYMLRKLPKKPNERLYLADDVALEYYRNEKVFEGSIGLEQQGQVNLDGQQHGGSASNPEEEKEKLSSIIERMNERFGTEFDPQDKLSRDQLVEDMVQDEDLQERAKNNSMDNFAFTFEDRFMDFLIDRMTDRNFFQKMMENEEQRAFLMNEMKEEVYWRLREQ